MPTLLRMSQPGLAWAGARRSRRAGQRLGARPKCSPVTRTKAGRPLEWEGVGLSPQGTCVPGSPSKMVVPLIAPCNPKGEETFTDGETETQKGTWLGHGNPDQKLLCMD